MSTELFNIMQAANKRLRLENQKLREEKKLLIDTCKTLITCLNEHIKEEAAREKVSTEQLCPCCLDIRSAEKIIEGVN